MKHSGERGGSGSALPSDDTRGEGRMRAKDAQMGADMQYGHFDNEKREYVIDRVDLPTSWTNYLGLKDMCAVVNHTAGGYMFYKTPEYHRITRFRGNSIPMDRPGHYVYIRDNADGDYWSISWQPVGKSLEEAKYSCRHGMSYTVYESEYKDIAASQKLSIPLEDPVELWDVKLKNNSDRVRELSVFSYCEFSFHHIMIDNQNFQMSMYCAGSSYEDGIIEHDLFMKSSASSILPGILSRTALTACGINSSAPTGRRITPLQWKKGSAAAPLSWATTIAAACRRTSRWRPEKKSALFSCLGKETGKQDAGCGKNTAARIRWIFPMPRFKNTGTAPVFLRVSYAEFWKDADGKVISGLVDGNEVVNKNWTEAWQNDWFDGGDGWYYYKKVLPANEMTAKVLTSLKFDSNYAEIYQTADYTLKFVSEAVQYSDDDSVNHRAVQANFGRDFKVISNNVITWN